MVYRGSKFVRVVWAANGVLMLLLLVGGIGWAGYLAVADAFQERSPERPDLTITNAPEEDTKWRLGYVTSLGGTPYVMVPLTSDKSKIESQRTDTKLNYFSSGGYRKPTRNVLFIDLRTNERRWLLPSRDILIDDIHQVRLRTEGVETGEVAALLYEVISKDSNGDGMLGREDLLTLTASSVSGEGYRQLLSGIERLVGISEPLGGSIVIIYQKGGHAYSAKVDVMRRLVETEDRLPSVQ